MANYLTCNYCGSQLQVHREGGAVYTQVLADIDSRTQRIEQDVEQLRRNMDLEQLDREWEMRRQTLLVRNKDGSSDVPSAIGGVIGAVIAVAFGIFWMVVTSRSGAPGFFPLFGLLIIGVGFVNAIVQFGKAGEYSRQEQIGRASCRERV